MSGKGKCQGNSAVESFFKAVKAELVWHRKWQSRREVEVVHFESINSFYNPRRMHSDFGTKSPLAFEHGAACHEHRTGTKSGQVQWRKLDSQNRQSQIIQGVEFRNGVKQKLKPPEYTVTNFRA
jgi:Integrase core domain